MSIQTSPDHQNSHPEALSSMPPSFAKEILKIRQRDPQNLLRPPKWQGNTLRQPGPAPAEMPIEIPAEALYNENL
jgi:hypothetical protein